MTRATLSTSQDIGKMRKSLRKSFSRPARFEVGFSKLVSFQISDLPLYAINLEVPA